jgi:hypothetical protein
MILPKTGRGNGNPACPGGKLKQIQARLLMGYGPSIKPRLAQAGAFAALAFHHLVALLQQALALAILALLLLFDVGAFFVGHAQAPDKSNA